MLEDSENDELRGPDRRDADLADEASVQDVILRHGGAVAGDEKRLLLSAAEECPESPLSSEEEADRVDNAHPEAIVIGLEDDELRPFVDGTLEEDEEPPNANVFPQRV